MVVGNNKRLHLPQIPTNWLKSVSDNKERNGIWFEVYKSMLNIQDTWGLMSFRGDTLYIRCLATQEFYYFFSYFSLNHRILLRFPCVCHSFIMAILLMCNKIITLALAQNMIMFFKCKNAKSSKYHNKSVIV